MLNKPNLVIGLVGLVVLIVGLLVLGGVQALSVASSTTVKGANLSTSLSATAYPGNFSIDQAIILQAHPTGQMNLTSVSVTWGNTCSPTGGTTTSYNLKYYSIRTGDSTMHRWYTFAAAGTYCGFSSVTAEINQTCASGSGDCPLLYNATSSDLTITVPGTGVTGCTHLCVHVTSRFTYQTNGLTITLNDASTVANGTIANITWHFGDKTCNLAPPATPASCYGSTTTHTYSANGTYTISETVVAANATGASATSTSTASVTVTSNGGGNHCGTNCPGGGNPPLQVNAQSLGFMVGGGLLAATGFLSAMPGSPISGKYLTIFGIPLIGFVLATLAGYSITPGVY